MLRQWASRPRGERLQAQPKARKTGNERVRLTRTARQVGGREPQRWQERPQTAGSDWQRRKTRKSTPLVGSVDCDTGECRPNDDSGTDTSEARVFDAEFLPLDSAREEHTCPWSFAEDPHDLGPSNVQLRNANGLSIPSGRKVMVSYDVLGP